MYMSVLSICTSTCQKIAPDHTVDGCEPPCCCWGLNSEPLGEQSVLLTDEPSLLPRYLFKSFKKKLLSKNQAH